ncbi:MAG: hypothetical protein HZA46_08065 [Planctomycetales bacterium]|nr:hypothetical protein [Planctomycetales bacterium]
MLRELLGKKRLRLNDDQRHRLAVKGKALGRWRLSELATVVTPDTILRWHRKLIAQKWDHCDQRKSPGRPRTGFAESKTSPVRSPRHFATSIARWSTAIREAVLAF